MTEWRVIPGFERYEASDGGHVRNRETMLVRRHRINFRGYHQVSILPGPPEPPLPRGAGRRKPLCMMVHRLVAFAFLPNPNNHPQVNHIDRDKDNNTLPNLEWSANLDNHRHSADAFLAANNPKRFHKLSVDDVWSIRHDLSKGATTREMADKWGVNISTICHIRNCRTRVNEPSAKEFPPPPKRPMLRAKEYAARDAEMVALAETGMSHVEIGKRFGVSGSHVSHLIGARKAHDSLFPSEVAANRD